MNVRCLTVRTVSTSYVVMVPAEDDGAYDPPLGNRLVELERDLSSPCLVSVEYPCLATYDQFMIVRLNDPPDIVLVLRADLITAAFG